MFGTERIATAELAALSRRLATQLAAGIDVRRIWTREAEASSATHRRRSEQVRTAVANGSSLAEALTTAGNYFPPLFCEMVDVGEQSGRLSDVFRQLTTHYEHQVQLRRTFRSAIAWPVIQLVLALSIIGILIWAMGFISQMTKSAPLDLLGLGLFGTRGLIIYFTFLILVASAAVLTYRAVRRGLLWTRPLQAALLRVPKLGSALETIAISRFAWSFYVTSESGMDLRRALDLSLRSTHSWRYISQIDPIWQSIRAGREIYEAMATTHVFPRSLVDAVEVGERSGRLSETLAVLSKQYQEDARLALGTLTIVAGFLVWAMVAALLITLIFRIAGTYLNVLNNAASGKF